MKNIIVGTAGHIDHGKTTLVRALTGIHTDRFEEEKRRGISIDLGFAHLDHAGVRFGFVDVPGHERFVRNMLAGAGGIDAVILVIAADESIKPQTREHFDICRLLGVRHGLIALTKADAVDPDLLELARLETADFVAGSFLEGAPIIPVSGVTGLGLGHLRDALAALAARIPGRDPNGVFRLPIDRSFSLHGFGTVVTGTLLSGTVHVEEEVEVYPAARLLRVRGVQVHGGAVPSASAGQRTAVNLPGVEASDLRRGMVLAPPGLFLPTRAIDCRFDLLPSAPPLKHRAPIHFHAGTAVVHVVRRIAEDHVRQAPGQHLLEGLDLGRVPAQHAVVSEDPQASRHRDGGVRRFRDRVVVRPAGDARFRFHQERCELIVGKAQQIEVEVLFPQSVQLDAQHLCVPGSPG